MIKVVLHKPHNGQEYICCNHCYPLDFVDRNGKSYDILVLVYRKGREETLYMSQVKHIESAQEYRID